MKKILFSIGILILGLTIAFAIFEEIKETKFYADRQLIKKTQGECTKILENPNRRPSDDTCFGVPALYKNDQKQCMWIGCGAGSTPEGEWTYVGTFF